MTFKQLTIADYSRPYKINFGSEQGKVAPVCAIGLEFEQDGQRTWSGVWFRVGAPKEEIAAALLQLSQQILAGDWGSTGDGLRLSREVNYASVEHLLPNNY